MLNKYIDFCCDNCGRTESHIEYVCDTCGTQLSVNGHLICTLGKDSPIELMINQTTYDFCNYNCLLKFIVEELKKQPPKEKPNV